MTIIAARCVSQPDKSLCTRGPRDQHKCNHVPWRARQSSQTAEDDLSVFPSESENPLKTHEATQGGVLTRLMNDVSRSLSQTQTGLHDVLPTNNVKKNDLLANLSRKTFMSDFAVIGILELWS